MNVVQAMAPMMKYRPRAATMATYSQSGRPLGRRWSCICITSVVPEGSYRHCAPSCGACDSSITASVTSTPCSQSRIGRDHYPRLPRPCRPAARDRRLAEIVVEVHGQLYTGPPKTRAGRRSVGLPRVVVEELAAHMGPVGPADAHVFTAEKGGVLRTSNFRIKVWFPAVRT